MLRNVFSVSKIVRPLVRHCMCVCSPGEMPSNSKLSILGNGVRVATEETDSPLAAVSLFIEAGSRYELSCNNGITHFIEHLAYKGFKSMTKHQLSDLLACMGAKLTAQTTRELQIFSATCFVECVPLILDIFTKIILEPAFNECEIECEKLNMCLEMYDADNDPKKILFDYLHQTAFQGTPLAQRVRGPTSNLDVFDALYCCNYVHDNYQPYKLAIVSSGRLDHCAMVNYVCGGLGNMPSDPIMVSEEGPCRFTGSEVLFRDDSLPFAHVAIAVEAPGFCSAEYYTLLAASYAIGSWHKNQGGLMNNASPLAQAGSTMNICQSFENFYIAYRDIGLWGVYFVAHQMALDDMMYNLQNTFKYFCMMAQYTDIKRGVQRAKLDLARSVHGSMNSCQDFGMQIMYRCGRHSLEEMCHYLDTVDHVNVRSACSRILYDQCPAVAAVGPTENMPEYTRIRAGMYSLLL